MQLLTRPVADDARRTRSSVNPIVLGYGPAEALGAPGFTAYVGLLDIGKPKAGETVVVAAASAAVGSFVGQIAKLKGCRVVVVADSAGTGRLLGEDGFDACIERRATDLPQQLAVACPKGIDVYFESAGGAVFDAVLPLLNEGARVPLSGTMAQYEDNGISRGQNRLTLLAHTMVTQRVRMQGFVISDYRHRYGEFFRQMSTWLKEGKVKSHDDRVDGLENAAQAFMGLHEAKDSASWSTVSRTEGS